MKENEQKGKRTNAGEQKPGPASTGAAWPFLVEIDRMILAGVPSDELWNHCVNGRQAALADVERHRLVRDSLEAAVRRVEIANADGDMILSAWLPDAKAALTGVDLAHARCVAQIINNAAKAWVTEGHLPPQTPAVVCDDEGSVDADDDQPFGEIYVSLTIARYREHAKNYTAAGRAELAEEALAVESILKTAARFGALTVDGWTDHAHGNDANYRLTLAPKRGAS